MVKNFKKAIALGLFGVLAAGSINSVTALASTDLKSENNTEVVEKSTNKVEVKGKTFTYENAPQKLKDEYEANCKGIGVVPVSTDEIFVPYEKLSEYGISAMERASYDTYVIALSGSTLYVEKNGVTQGSFNKNSTYVGYNHTTRGIAVTGLQILLNIFAYNHSGYSSVAIDGIFGSGTHSALLRYQSWAGLSQDATAGPNTWNSLIKYCL